MLLDYGLSDPELCQLLTVIERKVKRRALIGSIFLLVGIGAITMSYFIMRASSERMYELAKAASAEGIDAPADAFRATWHVLLANESTLQSQCQTLLSGGGVFAGLGFAYLTSRKRFATTEQAVLRLVAVLRAKELANKRESAA